ncbi:hypothetical protein BCR39DRAFT_526185 [Naematelia encephala]|uniref:Uncharacterized protein n=1 Tax=Naematelia encephala TaxID=71784 RepID=A0A1Y2BC50_9TREE|nr:hypothetical protein BCR39DRAFT_526185 [Naematelia encephala]
MIRSNPTAIPLRSSDVKLLQAEIDKRRSASIAPEPIFNSNPAVNSNSNSNSKGNTGESITPVVVGEGYNAVVQERAERQGLSVAERIGL